MASRGHREGHILAIGASHCPESFGDFGGVFNAGASLWGGAHDERMETSAKLTNKDRLRAGITFIILKGIAHTQKRTFCHFLLTLVSFPT